MTVAERIETKIATALVPDHLEVINESHMHHGGAGAESHFKLVIVSTKFEGKTLIKRHQAVNAILATELRDDIHALSMETLTAADWEKRGGAIMSSPQCLGGSKADAQA
ncbi:MAG: BolA/IbaG family iron-sulfur metabolism protein [Pseudomonadota bacterium]|nr:BolA/IbaG family iron-sulfur metabolism protein [Pseudomonadota bacterium]